MGWQAHPPNLQSTQSLTRAPVLAGRPYCPTFSRQQFVIQTIRKQDSLLLRTVHTLAMKQIAYNIKDATSKKGKTSGKTSLLMAWRQLYPSPPAPLPRRLVFSGTARPAGCRMAQMPRPEKRRGIGLPSPTRPADENPSSIFLAVRLVTKSERRTRNEAKFPSRPFKGHLPSAI